MILHHVIEIVCSKTSANREIRKRGICLYNNGKPESSSAAQKLFDDLFKTAGRLFGSDDTTKIRDRQTDFR